MGQTSVPWAKVPIGGLAYHPGNPLAVGEKIDEKTFRCKKFNSVGFVDFQINPELNADSWKLAYSTAPLE